MRPSRTTLLHSDFAVSKDRPVAVSHLRNKPITGKSYTTSVDATHGSVHNSYVNRYRRSLKPLLVDRFCPLDEGLLSQSNLVTIQGGLLVGAFRFAVLTWQGFLLIAAAPAKVRAPRRFAMAVAGYRLAPSALPLAWSVPGVEVTLGTGLISSWHPTFMLRLAPQSGSRT
ncbi:MauE/DoxX family redox-associated membrane protein [Micromonospora arborensis]|uniref:MauE/DoxX family redox-associated membrane protein n=1 Tax=Micromonospora arborensis TaxID=2116518 RepID=UPI0033C548C0